MNMNKVFKFISDNNIQPEALFALVDRVQKMNLSDETSIRQVIHEVSKLANRPIDKTQEDRLVKEIIKNGVSDNIFDIIK